MKKVPGFLCLIVLSTLIGCSSSSEDQHSRNNSSENLTPEVPSSDIANIQHIHADFDPISFNENVKDADLVAEIEIQGLITEMEDPSPQSIFKTNVLNILSGDYGDSEMNLLQAGTSTVVFNEFPQFSEGDRYILFLQKTTETPNTDYFIRGAISGVYKVVDENTIIKIALPDESLEDIQLGQVQQSNDNEIEQQVLDKNLFEELVKKEGN
ncbi:hypothetical protein J1TS1_25110 [Shouchella clausii]|uniref:hypothetical protein n=1 Tax=Shouchella TaxID=2893057 RepID=UPI001B17E5EB|nr:hypothetical protein [Shouchella clausii]GIN08366.1 hypothetical protein J1TS1_25110 [Shouchella clausii]